MWGSGDTGRSEKDVGPVSTVVEFVVACLSPPPDSDPPGVTPAGADDHMTHEGFFDIINMLKLSR